MSVSVVGISDRVTFINGKRITQFIIHLKSANHEWSVSHCYTEFHALYIKNLIDLGQTEDKKASLNDFEIVKTIGEGNFGKLYHVKTNQALAIKVLKKDAVKQRKEVDNVMSEPYVLVKSLNHPFLCKLHFSFQSTTKYIFVLDYINGGEVS
ncbi:hypothetical protein MN116_009005 [Schistosoma mekongi]|uniref:non-specific serine/threonine protein kinase n=1 Tax=Schistosoma mekongi TaxID=38744 RepID=A0AAE2D1N8_SCHME|nr:hypothetical protein MN116_009005 [Schistosoma mekongi]